MLKKERILRLTLVISSLGMGGAERVLSLLANYWAEMGHHITLITLDTAESDFFEVHSTVTRVALDFMSDSRNPMQAMQRNVQRVQRLRQAIIRSRGEAVISFIDKVNILTLLACPGLGIPVIVSERTVPMQYSIGRVWSGLRRLLYPHADALVVQSESVREWARSFLQDKAIHIIPNPVLPPGPANSQTSQTGSSLPSRPIIAAMGRLSAEKGFDLLIKASAQVLKQHSDWTVMILGHGPERQNLEELASHLGVSRQVRFQGHVKDPIYLLRQAELFVMASRFEGFPNALLEAMSCGLPVISTDCPFGPREIIRDGMDGILVPSEDVDALAEAMDWLMSDKPERERLAIRAVEVSSRFGLERVMGLWDNLLADVLTPKTKEQ